MTTQQRTSSPSSDSNDRNSFLDGGDVSVRESACRSLRILLPILALYTLFSLAWTTPIASVLHNVSSGNTIIRRTPKEIDTTAGTIITTNTQPITQDNSPHVTTTEIETLKEEEAPPIIQPPSTTTVTTEESEKQFQQFQQNQQTSETSEQTVVKQQDQPITPEERKEDTINSGDETQSEDDTVSTGSGVVMDEGPVVRPATKRRETYKLEQPACMKEGKRARSYLMVFMGHSGSTAIMSELKSHPQIYFDQFEPVDHGEIQKNTSMALEYTRNFFDRGIAEGKVPGFKIRPLHIKNDPKAWANLAREYDTRIIWQYRRNSLKQSVGEYSYRVLKDTSIVEGLKTKDEVKNRCDTGAGCSFAIDDFKAFHEILTSVTRSDFLIADAAHLIADGRDCVHEVRYEDYLYHRKGTMLDLLEFLGVDQVDTEPNRYKATKDNMCEVVTNWHEVCRSFYGCKVWRHLFEDKENGCSCKFSSSPAEFCMTPKLN